eukprot:9888059-Alexandrium_andersonii.AAC.1
MKGNAGAPERAMAAPERWSAVERNESGNAASNRKELGAGNCPEPGGPEQPEGTGNVATAGNWARPNGRGTRPKIAWNLEPKWLVVRGWCSVPKRAWCAVRANGDYRIETAGCQSPEPPRPIGRWDALANNDPARMD